MTRRTIITAAVLGMALLCANCTDERRADKQADEQQADEQMPTGLTWPVANADLRLWPDEAYQVVWVATVTGFDGVEVLLDVQEVLKGDSPGDNARLSLPRPVEPRISRALFRHPRTGDYVPSPPYVPLEFPYEPDRRGLTVGKQYVLYGLSTTDPASVARRHQTRAYPPQQELITLPSRSMSRAIGLTAANRDEAIAATLATLALAAIEDRTEQVLAIIAELPESGQLLRGTLVDILPSRTEGLTDKRRLVRPLTALLDSTELTIRWAAVRAMQVDCPRRSFGARPPRTPRRTV